MSWPLARLLEEPSAKGIYLFNTMRQTGDWRTEPKPESEWGRAECPPIVSEDLWNQVNQLIEENIRLAPEQYFWVHKRFKARGPDLPDVYANPTV